MSPDVDKEGIGAPTVSVCICTYNRRAFIRETIASVLRQTFRDFEIVVVDDASTDGTAEDVAAFGGAVRLVRRARNSGTADVPRYEAVRHARGRYVAFLDSDDLWDEPKLARQVEFMEAHPGIALSHHYVRIVDARGTVAGIRHEGRLPPTGDVARALLDHCFICTSSVMARRDAWLGAQEISTIREYGTEWDFFLSIARSSPIGLLDEVLGSYRRAATGISQQNWRRHPADIPARERILRKRLWEGIVTRDEYLAGLADKCAECAEAHRGLGHPGRSAWFCLRGLSHRPLCTPLWRCLAKAGLRAVLPPVKK